MDYAQIEMIASKIKEEKPRIDAMRSEIARTIIGQKNLVDRMIIAALCDSHILLEGLPGLAKTLAVRAFAKVSKLEFSRIQFTPDLLPADLTGTQVFNPKTVEFFVRKGPIFTNILLADEINRAPAKVQSALLQAMEERKVTIGDTTFDLPQPFMVLATENPIEQEGTYPLPEAQLDRFFMKVVVSYPDTEEEKEILRRIDGITTDSIQPVVDQTDLLRLKELAASVFTDEKIVDYVVRLIAATRKGFPEIERLVEFGGSPRASISLLRASRCIAFLKGRGFVTPDDIKEIAHDVLRHRIVLSYEAEAASVSTDEIVNRVLDMVEVP